MGNWRNRPPLRFSNKNYNKTPTTYHYDYPEAPHSSFVDDGVPSWEKKFCSLIGSLPWRKVVDAKKFMYCHGDILNWDDSAGKEAFQNAKERFWAEINRFPCDVSPPDPNMYIDEINWNPYIDPEAIKDLEQDLFVPDEENKGSKLGSQNKKRRNYASISSDGCYENTADAKNPWESNNNVQSSMSLIDKVKVWNQKGSSNNKLVNLNNDDNPWERGISQESDALKGKTWVDYGSKSWGWNHSGNHVYLSNDRNNSCNPWYNNCQGRVKDKRWDDARDGSWGSNQQESRKWNNGSHSWGNSFFQGNRAPIDSEWSNSGGSSRGWKQLDNCVENPKELDFRNCVGGLGTFNEGSRQREGSHQYITGYKSTNYQRDKGQSWRGGRTKRRVGFAFE